MKTVENIKSNYLEKNYYDGKILLLKPYDAIDFLENLLLNEHRIIGFEIWRIEDNGAVVETQTGESSEYFQGEYDELVRRVRMRLESLSENVLVQILIENEYFENL